MYETKESTSTRLTLSADEDIGEPFTANGSDAKLRTSSSTSTCGSPWSLAHG